VKQKSLRYLVSSALITTALSLLVGGYATISVKNSQIESIDSRLTQIVDSVKANFDAPVSAALDSASELDFNLTIALLSASGELTIINESQLTLEAAPDDGAVAQSLNSPISIDGVQAYRFISVDISGGDRLLIADSLEAINENFSKNLQRVFLVTFVADVLAIALSYLVIRRNNRKLAADSLSRMQRFLADASHELRTPLTVIKGYSEMLAKGQITVESDRQRAHERVNAEIIRMENLIQDLLLLAELGETIEPVFEEIDLTELISSYSRDFMVLNPGRDVALDIAESITVTGSVEHLRRLLLNIFNNISRHTPGEAPVRVQLSKVGKKSRLVIEDGGPGLPESSYRTGIELLNRFDASRSRETGGSGLGLSIIAAIVQEHSGNLTLRKSSLGGLALEITL
jgi:signal transduction histidine kinase